MKNQITTAKTALTLLFTLLILTAGNVHAVVTGAIFTTDSTCTGVNVNIFTDKGAVYIDGGPSHVGAAGLPPGSYYVQVTEPNGTVLGTSVGAGNPTPFVVAANGEPAGCYQLSAILIKQSNSSPGYDDTTNAGGEYKVWVSMDSTFPNSASKTDNFKVKPLIIPPQGLPGLCVTKFYDANANGTQDGTEPFLINWKVVISDNITLIRYTPVCLTLDPDTYQVMEFSPQEPNWINTTDNPVTGIVLDFGDAKTATFGNVCLGAGGGLTLGFWSNKNGQKLETANDFVALTNLHLVNADGSPRDFNSSLSNNKTALNSFLLGANANNMANMLSAQLTAMVLNVRHGGVSGGAIIYAPAVGFTSAGHSTGFITITDLITLADNALASAGGNSTVGASALRTYEEAIKTALDRGNNNLNFVQDKPCDYSFTD